MTRKIPDQTFQELVPSTIYARAENTGKQNMTRLVLFERGTIPPFEVLYDTVQQRAEKLLSQLQKDGKFSEPENALECTLIALYSSAPFGNDFLSQCAERDTVAKEELRKTFIYPSNTTPDAPYFRSQDFLIPQKELRRKAANVTRKHCLSLGGEYGAQVRMLTYQPSQDMSLPSREIIDILLNHGVTQSRTFSIDYLSREGWQEETSPLTDIITLTYAQFGSPKGALKAEDVSSSIRESAINQFLQHRVNLFLSKLSASSNLLNRILQAQTDTSAEGNFPHMGTLFS